MHTLTCVQCGAKFEHASPLALTCSHKCRLARKRNQDILAKSGRGRVGTIDVCPQCGKKYVVEGTTQRYCSLRCRRRKEGETARNAAKTKPARCIVCGRDFLTSKNSKAKTCGKDCLIRYKSILTTERERQKKADAMSNCETSMSCPWKSGKLDTMPLGVASWSDPVMDPMSGGFPMITFSVPSTAREVAA